MSDSEFEESGSNEEAIEIVGKLIAGCENFVVQRLNDFKTETSDTCSKLLAEGLGRVEEKLRTSDERLKKRLEEIDQKMKAKDSEIDSLKRVVREVKSESDKAIEDCDKRLETYDRTASRTITDLEGKILEQNGIIERQNSEISTLSQEIDQLKGQRPCACKELFDAYVTAGKLVFCDKKVVFRESTLEESSGADTFVNYTSTPRLDGTAGDDSTIYSLPSMTIERITPVTSTTTHVSQSPIFAETTGSTTVETIDSLPKVIVERMSSSAVQPHICASLFGNRCSETPSIYKDIEELPEEIRDAVKQHYGKRSKTATKELLSDLQVAYIRWSLANTKKGAPLKDEAKRLLEKGVADRIWTSTFCPEGISDFFQYMKQRIKNERVRVQSRNEGLKRMADTQQERLKGKICKK